MSTKAQLRATIKRESRILANANLDQLVDDIVADIMRDYCNLARYHELLLERVPITLVDGQQAYALPADYQNLAVVRYGVGPSTPAGYKELKEQTPTIRQTYSQGTPLFYRLVATGISLFPFGRVLATDTLSIDYYVDPASLYTDEGSPFPIPRLEGAVKKAAIARIQRFHSSDTEAQMTSGDSGGSFNASNAAS